jgi:hypothetical protein
VTGGVIALASTPPSHFPTFTTYHRDIDDSRRPQLDTVAVLGRRSQAITDFHVLSRNYLHIDSVIQFAIGNVDQMIAG